MKTRVKKVLLVNDADYLPVLLSLLDQARTSIDVMAFSFSLSTSKGIISGQGAPYEIAHKLIEIKKHFKKKIEIRLYIEAERETADRNTVTAKWLKDNGVVVKYGATHAKGFCIDHKYVLFGSTNLTNQSIVKNNESNLLIEDAKICEGFDAYFQHLWRGGRHGGLSLDFPWFADGDFKAGLLEAIDQAQTSLYFSIYFFDQKEIERALIGAHERGVKITGLIHTHFSFALSYVRRTRRTVDRMKQAGIADLHYGPGGLFTHSKFLVADKKILFLGTGNWLDEDIEIHPQLYIQLENPKLAKEVVRHLQTKLQPK